MQQMHNISALSGFLQCAASPAPPSGAACVQLASSSSSPRPSPSPAPLRQPSSDIDNVVTSSPLPDVIQGSKMRININNCPSELRRFSASPYVVIQKYNKAYYLKKQYWAKLYEVQYALLKNPLSAAPPSSASDEEQPVPATSRKSFVAATGDEIGLFGEGPTPNDAALDLQIKLCRSILQLLEEGQSHCLPSKRKHQDVLLKDYEEEMVSHGVKFLSPPKYVAIKITFDFDALKKPREPTPAGLGADGASSTAPTINGAPQESGGGPATSAPAVPTDPAQPPLHEEPPATQVQQAVQASDQAPAVVLNGDTAATPSLDPNPTATTASSR